MPINAQKRKASVASNPLDDEDSLANQTLPTENSTFSVIVSPQKLDDFLIRKCRKRTKDWDISNRMTTMGAKLERCQPFQTFGMKLRGGFETHPGLECRFTVEPAERWYGMARFDQFRMVGPAKRRGDGVPMTTDFEVGTFIWVANERTLASVDIDKMQESMDTSSKDFKDYGWVGKIMEIRAQDAQNVFLRLVWMYWPDDLEGSKEKGRAKGRQAYHGRCELIASNHMDIINASTVSALASVSHWREDHEHESHRYLYWRQALDIRTQELSPLYSRCVCKAPENPDRHLIACCNPDCYIWLHDNCVIDSILSLTWGQLGLDKVQSDTDSPVDSSPSSQQSNLDGNKGRGRRKKRPWKGWFTGRIVNMMNTETNMASNTPLVEITDKRGLKEGIRTWTHKIRCLECGVVIEK